MPNQNTGGNNNTAPTDADAPTERRSDVHATNLTRFQIEQLATVARLSTTNTVASGAAIQGVLTNYLDEKIHPPRIYQNLDDLVEVGVLTRSQHDGRTDEYELTEAGDNLLLDRIQWLADQLGLQVVDAAGSDDDDGRPDGGAEPISADGGWSLENVRDVLTPVHEDHEVTGLFSEETIPVAEHDCLQVNVRTPDGPTIKFGCVECGHVSNAVTGFVQHGCDDSDENPLVLTDGGLLNDDSACENCGDRTAVATRTAAIEVSAVDETRAVTLALCRPCADAFDWGDGTGPLGPGLPERHADRRENESESGPLVTDGGRPTPDGRIDPLVCPRGHHSINISANRFNCETCRRNDFATTAWDRSELADLREGEPPLADGGSAADRMEVPQR
jgi:DNA-binding MarR family transcriptional regulator